VRTRLTVLLAVIGLTAGLAGCQSPATGAGGRSGPVPTPEPAAAQAAGLSAEDIESGRRLYGTKCARCHKCYDPAKYDESAWRTWMRKMSRKAKLDPVEDQTLGRYLDAFRAPGGASAPTSSPGP